MQDLGELSQVVQGSLAQLLPGMPLRWYTLPGGLRGYFLEQEPALAPLSGPTAERVMDAPPFWSLLWPSGEFLCRLLMQSPELVRDRRVLDFGSGCGLVACAAARSGARPVWAVDCDSMAVRAGELHALANQVSVEVLSQWDGREVDLVLLADFLYDATHLPLFEALASRAKEVLVVDSRLSTLPVEGFERLGRSAGVAIPDLEQNSPRREFGELGFWYRGPDRRGWAESLRKLCVSPESAGAVGSV